MAFCRRVGRVSSSALVQTPQESVAGSPELFKPPSEKAVGQTSAKLAFSWRPSYSVVREKGR